VLRVRIAIPERRRRRHELDGDGAVGDGRFRQRARSLQLLAIAITRHVAYHVVQRDQSKAKREAAGNEQPQLPGELAILVALNFVRALVRAHGACKPRVTLMAMNPK